MSKDPPGKPVTAYRDVERPLRAAFTYFRTHVERLPGRRQGWPRSGEMRDLALGFILSTEQLHAATITLMADRRPQQAVLAAGVVARALIEGVGNLMALMEDPIAATAAFARDDYRHTHRRVEYNETRWGRPYPQERQKLAAYGRALGLSGQEIDRPDLLRYWPSPDKLLKRSEPPRLRGERRCVFEELYRFWYASLSAMSHHRMTALQLAVFTERRLDEATFTLAKSETALLAVLSALCVLSEVELHFAIDPCPHLRAAWVQVRKMNDLSTAVYSLRYGARLAIDA